MARLLVGLGGLSFAALGLAGCFLCPGLVGYAAAALIVPCGGWFLLIALRGRRSDMQEITRELAPASVGSATAGEVIAKVAEIVADNV